jgi:hypothetical protein
MLTMEPPLVLFLGIGEGLQHWAVATDPSAGTSGIVSADVWNFSGNGGQPYALSAPPQVWMSELELHCIVAAVPAAATAC